MDTIVDQVLNQGNTGQSNEVSTVAQTTDEQATVAAPLTPKQKREVILEFIEQVLAEAKNGRDAIPFLNYLQDRVKRGGGSEDGMPEDESRGGGG